ncbi:MAG: hypothetical protein GF401_04655 [Chitinivibrionales bacterium]|nr:hypothetical protein [Chitinivibrionales bacterium]
MDFDFIRQLIPIIFLIIWFFARAQARKKEQQAEKEFEQMEKSRKPAGPANPQSPQEQKPDRQLFQGPVSSVKDDLKGFFNDISDAIKKDLPSSGAEKPEVLRRQQEKQVAKEKAPTPRTEHKKTAIEKKSQRPAKPRPSLAAKEPGQKKTKEYPLELSPEKLRDAVVLSEILAPPVGLRK